MKLTFIWQGLTSLEESCLMSEYAWVKGIFNPLLGEEVFERKHSIVVDNCLLIDAFPRAHSSEYYQQFRGKKAWLFHRGDETYDGGYEVYSNFRGVFRTYWSEIFDPRCVMQLPLGFSQGLLGGMSERSAAERPFLWSFLGEGGKTTRPDMLKALANVGPSFVQITDLGPVQRLGKAQYEQILSDSVFVPCCMGNVNLETYRVYEALECGAVPILEKRTSLDYFRGLLGDHPMPSFVTWEQAARFMLAIQHDRAAQDELLLRCSRWWEAYKRDLTQRIQDFVAQSTTSTSSTNAVRWRGRIPGRQALELMRHHSVPALARRAQRQFTRLKDEKLWRKTTGA
jgi:hypothetical protein